MQIIWKRKVDDDGCDCLERLYYDTKTFSGVPFLRPRGKPRTITLWRNAQRVVSERWPSRTGFGEVSPKT